MKGEEQVLFWYIDNLIKNPIYDKNEEPQQTTYLLEKGILYIHSF